MSEPSPFVHIIEADVAAICLRRVGRDEALVSSGLLDSVALVDLAVALEKSFGFRIPLDALTSPAFDTVDGIDAYLRASSGR